ncbi:MAG: DUF4143 domain-containing protein [Oscillospiraceae bacterium]|nr:DUF4143 domain-containing protein [Oscillospiraceae bacterium]MCL2279923.1 DUF4143 domain-containing protein [Oscillospiraceae bacterium]
MAYIKRIVDSEIELMLKVTGALLVKGPKWCGKTTSARQFAKSEINFQDENTRQTGMRIAENKISLLLDGENPRLLDEWQEIPGLWNAVKTDVDNKHKKGLYILTGSATPNDELNKGRHSGLGRFSLIEMKPMTLFESGDSNGSISLKDIVDGVASVDGKTSYIDYERLAYLTCRSGFPSAVTEEDEQIALHIVKSYVTILCEEDISRIDNTTRNPQLARNILKSYARNVATINSDQSIYDDVRYNYGDVTNQTLMGYMNILKRLYVIDEVPAWNPNIRSKTSIRTSAKKGFIDPAIACSVLEVSPKELALDPKTFGFLFENLVNRDLSVYSGKSGGFLRHYRDRTGLECDHVIHFSNGKYGLVQAKLGNLYIDQGIEKLRELKKLIVTKNKEKKIVREPDFFMVITGGNIAYTTKDGIHVVPIGCLKD